MSDDRYSGLDGEFGPSITPDSAPPPPVVDSWNVPENPAIWDGYTDDEDEYNYQRLLDRRPTKPEDKVVYVTEEPQRDKDEFGI